MRGRICQRTAHPENSYIRNKRYSFTNCLTDTSDKTVLMRKVCWYIHSVNAELKAGEHPSEGSRQLQLLQGWINADSAFNQSAHSSHFDAGERTDCSGSGRTACAWDAHARKPNGWATAGSGVFRNVSHSVAVPGNVRTDIPARRHMVSKLPQRIRADKSATRMVHDCGLYQDMESKDEGIGWRGRCPVVPSAE